MRFRLSRYEKVHTAPQIHNADSKMKKKSLPRVIQTYQPTFHRPLALFGSLNICIPYTEYSTFCRDRMENVVADDFTLRMIFTGINGIGLCQFLLQAICRRRISLIFFNLLLHGVSSHWRKYVVDISYFQYTACGVCYSLSTGSRVRFVFSESEQISGYNFFCDFLTTVEF